MRANTYSLLGNLLARKPDEALLDRLRALEIEDNLKDNAMACAWQSLGDAARNTSAEAVDDEYHALFVGIGRGEVMPYASWYLTGFLMEQPLVRVREDLKTLGFERKEEVKEPEDHAAALMETMCIMITDDSGISIHMQKQFFNRHLSPWIAKFFVDLHAAKSANLYRAVGVLGSEFINLESQYLEMSPH